MWQPHQCRMVGIATSVVVEAGHVSIVSWRSMVGWREEKSCAAIADRGTTAPRTKSRVRTLWTAAVVSLKSSVENKIKYKI